MIFYFLTADSAAELRRARQKIKKRSKAEEIFNNPPSDRRERHRKIRGAPQPKAS